MLPLSRTGGVDARETHNRPVRAMVVPERVVDTRQVLVVIALCRLLKPQRQRIVAGARVRQREPVAQDFHGGRAEERRRDPVVREDLAGKRVAQLPRDRRKVPAPHRGRWYQTRSCRRTPLLVRALIGAEEEGLVPHDWAADRAAVLRALQPVVDARRKEIVGVELVVAEVAEAQPVELVGPRAGDGVDDRADIPAVLRAEAVRLDAELLQRVRIRHRVGTVAVMIVVGPAVEHVVGRVAACAARRHRLRPRVGRAGRQVGTIGQDAGHERHQLRGVAAVQRQVFDALLIDHGSQRAAGRVHRGRHPADRHRLGHRADLQPDVEPYILVHANDDVRVLRRLEP